MAKKLQIKTMEGEKVAAFDITDKHWTAYSSDYHSVAPCIVELSQDGDVYQTIRISKNE